MSQQLQAQGSLSGVSEAQRAYPLPSKSTGELERLDTQHAVFTVRIGGLYKAKFPENATPRRVLDVGCGTGVWSRAFAARHPTSQVLGIDLSPPPPAAIENLLPNCSFQYGDFENEWSFVNSDESLFDFVYMRMLMAAVRDWPALLRKAWNVLRPGGILEVFEGLMELKASDGSTSDTSYAMRWFEMAQAYLAAHSIKWDLAREDLPRQLVDAGFEIVEDVPVKMTTYPDPKDPEADRVWVASKYVNDMTAMITGMTGRFRMDPSSRLSSEEWDTLAEEASKELRNEAEKRGFYATLYVRVARKPE